MKINWITTLTALCISLLITYGFYSFLPIEKNTALHNVTISFSFIFIFITFVLSIGVSFPERRTTVVVRTSSLIFFCIGILSLILLTYFNSTIPFLIIFFGILLLIYFLIIYAFVKAE
tara:strand:+ start:326 stop:679 length:354 start_codon:yes stop_codon:yes gene_type:complete